MKLIDMTLKGFTEELSGNSPAPGGGSTAAVEGAFGAGLVSMVCELTLGNRKYEEHHAKAEEIRVQAKQLADELLKTVDEDTEAFNLVSAAFSMPKQTDEEKAARRTAIQDGLKQCCLPPLKVMRCSYEALKLAKQLIGSYNTSTASDLGTGIASLKSAVHGAYLNVLINAGSIKDEEYVAEKKAEAQQLYDSSNQLADALSKQVLEELSR